MQRFTLEFIVAARPCRHAPGDRWFADETHVKVAGKWTYPYRAVDQHGQVIDVPLSVRRDLPAARRFFTRALRADTVPVEVTTDRAPVYPRPLMSWLPRRCTPVVSTRTTRSRLTRAAEGPAAADARTQAPPLRADPRRRTCLRAEPPPRPLRHRYRSSQPPSAPRGIRRPRARHLNLADHPDHAPTLFREGITQQCRAIPYQLACRAMAVTWDASADHDPLAAKITAPALPSTSPRPAHRPLARPPSPASPRLDG